MIDSVGGGVMGCGAARQWGGPCGGYVAYVVEGTRAACSRWKNLCFEHVLGILHNEEPRTAQTREHRIRPEPLYVSVYNIDVSWAIMVFCASSLYSLTHPTFRSPTESAAESEQLGEPEPPEMELSTRASVCLKDRFWLLQIFAQVEPSHNP